LIAQLGERQTEDLKAPEFSQRESPKALNSQSIPGTNST
jgi:hypothetical protein